MVKPLRVSMKAWAAMAMVLVMALAVACSSSPTPAAPAAPGVTPAELQAALSAAVQAAPSGPSAAEISSMVASAVEGAVPEGTDPAEISRLVQAAVSAATAKAAGSAVTAGDIRAAISAAAAASSGPDPLSAGEVAAIVAAAVAAIPTPAPVMAPVAAPASTPSYWNPPTAFYGDPVYGGNLRINYEDPLDHANIWGAQSGVTVRYRMPTMNSIVAEDPYNAGAIIPDLASNWQDASDLTGITINFEDGIKWHNGDDFTCEDARFTIETMITGKGLTASEMAGKLGFIDLDKTSCANDTSLHIGFTGQSTTALLTFTDRAFVIFNKKWFEDGGEDVMFNDVSVGTGPFKWAAGQSVGVDEQVFERNVDYFKPGLPYVDQVNLFGILDESAQQAAMLAHQTDWHWVRNFGQYDAYVEHDQIQTVIRATRGHHSIWLNKANPPLDNIRVRQAIFMGIDRNAGINVLLQGHGSQGFIMPPGGPWDLTQEEGCAIPAWCEPAGGYEAQRAEAIAILNEENFDFDKEFIFTVEADEQVQARATFIQEQLRLLGIKTDFDIVETVAYRVQESEGTWGDIMPRNDTMPADDPSAGMGYYFNCISPRNHWTPQTECDPYSEALLAKIGTVVDPAERKALSDELQKYGMEQYWKFPLYWEQEAVSFWPEIRGYYHHPQPSGAFVRWEQLWIDPSHANDTGFSGQTSGVPGGQ